MNRPLVERHFTQSISTPTPASSSVGPAKTRQQHRRLAGEGALLFLACLALNLAVAFVLPSRPNRILPEAMERTVRAWLVLSGDLSLLSIPSSTQPLLPTLLELPFAALPYLSRNGISGIVMAAVYSALTCAVLDRALAGWLIARRWRYPLVACFALNPTVLLLTSGGSSESVSMLLVLTSIHFLAWWHRTGNLQALISLGFSLGLASLALHQPLLYAGSILVLVWLLEGDPNRAPSGPRWAPLVTCAMPVVFVLGGWVLCSLLLPYGPQEMLRVGYLAAVQAAGSLAYLASPGDWATDTAAAAGAATRTLTALSPLFVAATLLLADFRLSHRRLSLALMAIAFLLPLAQLPLPEDGAAPWPERLLPTVPLVIVLVGHLLSGDAPGSGRSRVAAVAIRLVAAVALALSVALPGFATVQHVDHLAWGGDWEEERSISRYLLDNADGGRVLVDLAEGYPIVFFTGQPEMFDRIQAGGPPRTEAREATAKYLLIRDPWLEGLSKALSQYPTTVADSPSESTIHLLKEWPSSGWRLFALR